MIKNVAKISDENAELLKTEVYEDGKFFNPTQDAVENWIISLQEAQHLDLSKWEVIEFNPKIEENEFTTEN